jgi:hypothetical protein
MNKSNNNLLYFAFFSVFLVGIFSAKDLLILQSSLWGNLYPVVNTPAMTFEEIFCYLPLVNHFSLDTPLPIAPMSNPGLSELSLFPALTIIVQGIIFKWVCFSDINLYLLLNRILFPLASFWLLVAIYRRFIALPWALLLAFWGVTFYYDFSMTSYLWSLASNPGAAIELASSRPMEITRVPIPSFSFFYFILCFYCSIKTYKISSSRQILLSTLWALNAYVYLHNYISGIVFWLSYLIFTNYITHSKFGWKTLFKTLGLNSVIIFLVTLPFLLRLASFSGMDYEAIQNYGLIYRNAGVIFNSWGLIFSYFLPVALTAFIIRVYCSDYYELFYKFTPIFLMIFSELFTLNIHLVIGAFFQPELFSIRIGNYFTRFLYYIPVIYFFSLPPKNIDHGKVLLRNIIHSIILNRVIRQKIPLVIAGIAVVSFMGISSNLKYLKNHNEITAPRMIEVEREFQELISISGNKGTIISGDIPVNLMVSIYTQNTSLLVNSFNNYIPRAEIIERLALFAKIFLWEENQFIKFMMPSENLSKMYKKNNFLITDRVLEEGFGYWLVWHIRDMSSEELVSYKKEVSNVFNELNIKNKLREFNVKYIQSRKELNPEVPFKILKSGKPYSLYKVKL